MLIIGGGPRHSLQLASFFIRRASGLGTAFALERSLSFAASLLAARAGGPQVFGAYVTALTTASTIAGFAGSPVSTVGIRFAAEYSRDAGGRLVFLCLFAIMAILGAAAGAGTVAGSAHVLAEYLFGNTQLGPVLQMAAVLTAGLVLLDALRGLLVGWPHVGFVILMAGVGGLGLILVIPAVAATGASAMVHAHALVVLGTVVAIVALLVLGRRHSLSVGLFPGPWRTIGGRLVEFAGMQIVGFGGIAAASWFLSAMVTRSDTSLHEMAFYGVAGQVRVLVLAVPALLAQAVHPLLTTAGGEEHGGPDRVTVSGTVITTVLVLVMSGLVLAVLPFGVSAVYGPSYLAAEAVCAVMVISGVVHMSGVVPRNRLGVAAVRRLAAVSAGWTALVVVGAVFIVPVGGALAAASVLLVADMVSHVLAVRFLGLQEELQRALNKVSIATIATSLCLALVWIIPFGGAWVRALSSVVVALAGAISVWAVDWVSTASNWQARAMADVSPGGPVRG